MQKRTPLLIVGLLLIAAACGGAAASPSGSAPPTASPSPGVSTPPDATVPPDDGVEGLLEALRAAGADAETLEGFDGSPLAVNGTLACVDGAKVRLYIYPSLTDATGAAGRIDPDDPTNIGTSIVEWDGTPKFWQRGRVLVLYVDTDEAIEGLLTSALGDPFARGQGGPPRGDETC